MDGWQINEQENKQIQMASSHTSICLVFGTFDNCTDIPSPLAFQSQNKANVFCNKTNNKYPNYNGYKLDLRPFSCMSESFDSIKEAHLHFRLMISQRDTLEVMMRAWYLRNGPRCCSNRAVGKHSPHLCSKPCLIFQLHPKRLCFARQKKIAWHPLRKRTGSLLHQIKFEARLLDKCLFFTFFPLKLLQLFQSNGLLFSHSQLCQLSSVNAG